jgi:3-hydroxymyristoyl/3-hydroxydecanoyl-(acyl carrier protein) dehydratase
MHTYLQQRFPMLLIDRISGITEDEITGFYFNKQGYEEHPLLFIETCGQLAEILYKKKYNDKKSMLYLSAIPAFHFLSLSKAGETLTIKVRLQTVFNNFIKSTCTVFFTDTMICEGEIIHYKKINNKENK